MQELLAGSQILKTVSSALLRILFISVSVPSSFRTLIFSKPTVSVLESASVALSAGSAGRWHAVSRNTVHNRTVKTVFLFLMAFSPPSVMKRNTVYTVIIAVTEWGVKHCMEIAVKSRLAENRRARKY